MKSDIVRVGLGLLNYVKEQGYIFIDKELGLPHPTQGSILPYTHTTHGLRIQDSLTPPAV
jgi:hypothetical protein